PREDLNSVENESQKRTAVAFGLIFLLTAVYMTWFAPSATPPHAAGAVDGGTVATTTPTPAPAPVTPAPPVASPPSAGTPPGGPASRTFEVSRKLIHYVFSTEGAGLVSAKLQGEKTRDQRPLTMAEGWAQLVGKDVPKGPQMDLAQPIPGAPLPLSMELAGESPIPPTLRYSAEQGDHRITFVGRTESWEVTKEISWVDDGYELSTRVTLRNLTSRPLSGELVLPYGRAIDPAHEEKPSFFGGVGNVSDAACFVKDAYEHETVQDKTATKEFTGPVRWVAINQQYFVSAIFPVGTAVEGKCVLTTSLSERIATVRFPLQVGPGQSVTKAFGAFLGPKETEVLADVPRLATNRAPEANAPVHLERAVDYGIWAALCKPMLWFLKKIHGIVGNWGVAIILLTVVVKVLLIPLTHRAMVGQEAMKKLQPKIEEVKKKFPEDKERQQMEMMKAYQEAGVNPFGSCLMILVQLPVWAALFTTLRNSYELYGVPFTSHFLTDLTIKDPTYLLPVLLGVSQIITSKLQPPALDPAQQRMMVWFMPIFFTVIMLNYPAGLLLYIFTNNILTVAQQAVLKRMVGSTPTPPLKPALEKRK
ncbi:MAG TPA: membrane protein insertase YidC, partial [Myxococcaceae bacterium]|nr:membrane protein insertase YidC [Myxococcaceae bacterium]